VNDCREEIAVREVSHARDDEKGEQRADDWMAFMLSALNPGGPKRSPYCWTAAQRNDATERATWLSRSRCDERPERQRPGNRQGDRIEAHLVVAGLVLERAANRQRGLSAKRRLRRRRAFDDDLPQQPEGLPMAAALSLSDATSPSDGGY
jgi:hypothetical protein